MVDFDRNIASLHKNFLPVLRKFKGDTGALHGLQSSLDQLLLNFYEKAQQLALPKKVSLWKVKLVGAVLAIFMAIWIIFDILQGIKDRRAEELLQSIWQKHLPLYSHDIVANVRDRTLLVRGYAVNDTIIATMLALAKQMRTWDSIENRVLIVNFDTFRSLDKKISMLSSDLLDVQLLQVKSELEKIVVRFPMNVTKLSSSEKLQIRRIYEILKKYPRIQVDVVAFSDPSGGLALNRQLANARIRTVMETLVELGLPRAQVSAFPYDPELLRSDERLKKFQHERGIMIFVRLQNSHTITNMKDPK